MFDQRRRAGQRRSDLETELAIKQVAHGHQHQGMVIGKDYSESFHSKAHGEMSRWDIGTMLRHDS
jgi:hypothetical protein